ncbi:RICIN domain-containing protein [Kitasatospora sp. NPDC002040]|uniref:RICIN domain-containing protein n=1 Tax=Kitasatospora sp. NPDC002040 TaxID=3154661 RepID=UPI00332D6624
MTRLRIGLGIATGVSALSLALVAGATAQGAQSLQAAGATPPAVGSAAGPSLTTTSYRTTHLSNGNGGQCLDADLNTIGGNGTKVQLWGCNGWSNQTWIWTPVAGQPVGYYTIQTEKNYRCLDADLNTINGNGTKVQLWDCNGWDNQIWLWNGTTLQTKKNARVLDADANTIPRDGTKVQLWDRNGWANQRWIFG